MLNLAARVAFFFCVPRLVPRSTRTGASPAQNRRLLRPLCMVWQRFGSGRYIHEFALGYSEGDKALKFGAKTWKLPPGSEEWTGRHGPATFIADPSLFFQTLE